jgi:uncharacterized metal-binding protein YceD (DUF177 family)
MTDIMPEFSRPVRIDTLGGAARSVEIEAGDAERAALAGRFGLIAIERLTAKADLSCDGDTVVAAGSLSAAVIQSCVASGEPVAAAVKQPFRILFRPEAEAGGDEEIELSEEECDVVFYAGAAVDLGESVAETLFLALDPYPRSPAAAKALEEAGVKSQEEAGPFAALAALKGKLGS